MRLLTVGDSFTYGDELAELTSAWPFILGNKLGYEVTNLAKPGSGNTRMVRYCVEQANNYDLVIIAWSHFARWEWADQKGFYDIWPGCSPHPHEQTAPWRKYLIDHINYHHDDDYLYRQYLINIILLQHYLKLNNIKYLMLDAFGNHQYSGREDIKNQDLLTQVDGNYFLGWPIESMMEWTQNEDKGPKNHFLEQGHVVVANKIYEKIKALEWGN